jgi:hypothetical protein
MHEIKYFSAWRLENTIASFQFLCSREKIILGTIEKYFT